MIYSAKDSMILHIQFSDKMLARFWERAFKFVSGVYLVRLALCANTKADTHNIANRAYLLGFNSSVFWQVSRAKLSPRILYYRA